MFGDIFINRKQGHLKNAFVWTGSLGCEIAYFVAYSDIENNQDGTCMCVNSD